MRLMTVVKIFIVLVLFVVGLGFYQGWFVLSKHDNADGDNKVDVNLTVDPDKVKEDANAVGTKFRDLTGGGEDEPSPSPSENGEPAIDN